MRVGSIPTFLEAFCPGLQVIRWDFKQVVISRIGKQELREVQIALVGMGIRTKTSCYSVVAALIKL